MLPWHDEQTWSRLRRGEGCPLCGAEWLAEPIIELPTSRIRVPARACLTGYACAVYRRHVAELHELTPTEAAAFIEDIRRLSAAVQRASGAAKINLLSIGNLVPHLHMHVCPRRPGDRFDGRTIDPGDVVDAYGSVSAHAAFVDALRRELR